MNFTKYLLLSSLLLAPSLGGTALPAWANQAQSFSQEDQSDDLESPIETSHSPKINLQFSPGDGSTIGGTADVEKHHLKNVLSHLPKPSQSSLNAVIARANRVRIFEGGSLKGKLLTNKILLDSKEANLRTELARALKIDEDPNSFCQQISLGGPTIELLRDRKRLALITFQPGEVIRWEKRWRFDASLSYGRRLVDWFADNGVEGPKLAFEEQLKDKRRTSADLRKWMMSMPDCLRPYWGLVVVPGMSDILIYSPLPSSAAKAAKNALVSISANPRLEKINSILDEEFPDPQVKILTLLQWYASGGGAWTGFPSYEELPAELLLQMPSQKIIEALHLKNVSEPELDGAARFFASHLFRVSKPKDLQLLDQPLRLQLLKQSMKSDDMDKRYRAESAFNTSK